MENHSTGPVRAGSLVLELAARTVIVDGRRVELPPTEFSLLAVLAARPGEVVPHKDLLQEAFGDSAYMNSQDLHWRIWNIRKLIGDANKTIIRNRRGVGFLLEQGNIQVVDGRVEAPAEAATHVIPLDEPLPETPAPDAATPPTVAVDDDPARRRFVLSPLTLLILGLVAGLALGGSWLAGYSLSEQQSPTSPSATARQEPSDLDEGEARTDRPNKTRRGRDGKRREKQQGRRKPKRRPVLASGGSQAPAGVAPDQDPGPTEVASVTENTGSQPAPQRPARQAPAKKPPAPSYPPAPTRYLYHLVNPQTGDHFVTTESATASEHQAMGYEGGAIARVYNYQEKDTKAVSTNEGTAYVFISPSPKTEPASSIVSLWYSTNGNGDFFYTTNESEAKRSGWQGSLIGYARSL